MDWAMVVALASAALAAWAAWEARGANRIATSADKRAEKLETGSRWSLEVRQPMPGRHELVFTNEGTDAVTITGYRETDLKGWAVHSDYICRSVKPGASTHVTVLANVDGTVPDAVQLSWRDSDGQHRTADVPTTKWREFQEEWARRVESRREKGEYALLASQGDRALPPHSGATVAPGSPRSESPVVTPD